MAKILFTLVAIVFTASALTGCRAEVEGTDHSNVTAPR
jgi:hypothetical protein